MPFSDADFRSSCPLASSLDLIGDKWTLVIIRDLYLGATRYSDFLSSPEGIPTNLLSERLKQLEAYGIISKEPYQKRPVRHAYQLTAMGMDLVPVMRAFVRWGMTWLPNRKARPPEGLAWKPRTLPPPT